MLSAPTSSALNIGILVSADYRLRLPSVDCLADAIERAGHAVIWLDPAALSALGADGELHTFCAGEAIEVDGVLRWMSSLNANLVHAALAVLEAAGMPFLNSNDAVRRSSNKWATAVALSGLGLPHPATALVRTMAEAQRLAGVLGYPLVVKTLTGFGGRGVGLARDSDELHTVMRSLRPHGEAEPIIVQRFLPEAAGRDLRVTIVGNTVVDAYERQALVPGEFRSNVMRGGRRIETEITREEATVAAAALRAVGLDWGGVDLARSSRGPVVIEVNATPGFGQRPPEVSEAIGDAVVELLVGRIRAA